MLQTMPVDPVYRIPNVKVDDKYLVERATDKFGSFERDRTLWVQRREKYYLAFDDYTSPVRKGLWDGASNLRFPLTETQVNAMHALVLQAIFFRYPWFFVDPQEEVDTYRILKIERFMKYVLERYVNYHKGIYLACDDWAFDLVTEGMAIFNRGWKVDQRKFISIEDNAEFKSFRLDLQKMLEDTEEQDFDLLAKEFIDRPYVEKSIIRTVFNGPTVHAEDPIYVLFKGDVVDSTDLNEHETVVKVCYFNRNTLLDFKDSEYMDSDAVDQILSSPGIKKGTTWRGDTRTRRQKDIQTGVNTTAEAAGEDLWEFLLVYDTAHLNPKDKGMADRLQYYVHPETMALARWTYLDRISANGKIPLHMAHLYRRPRRSTGRGVVHTMYPLNEGLDILLNQSIDAGMLANNPMFAFKGDSTFDPGEIRMQPGLGIKTDDPNTDLRFFTWKVNPSWSQAIQGTLVSMAQQYTGMGPSQMGQVGARVGPLRSTSGVNTLDQNASMIHDPVLKRVKICISDLYEGLYMDCIDRMPDKLHVTITGAGGVPIGDGKGGVQRDDITLSELSRKVHFGLYANSLNLNVATEKENAAAIAQFSFQPAPMKMGIVGPNEVYEIMYNLHRAMGNTHPEKYLAKPAKAKALPLEMEMRMIMQGITPPIAFNDPDHQRKIDVMQQILDNPDQAKLEAQHGGVAANALDILEKVVEEHRANLEMLKKPSNVENPFGNNQSPTMGQGGEGGGGEGDVDAGAEFGPETTNINNVTNVGEGGEGGE